MSGQIAAGTMDRAELSHLVHSRVMRDSTLIPDYAGNGCFSWLVIDEMRRRGYEYGLCEFGGTWSAEFDGEQIGQESGGADGCETPSEAICNAALDAVAKAVPR